MANTNVPASREEAEALDLHDPLAPARSAFVIPDGVIYLDGHSLGPATHAALARTARAASEEWAHGLIRSWNDAGWIDLPIIVGAQIARLIGASPEDVIVCDSVSVNLFKLATAALPLARNRILLVEETEFPTDQYIAEGIAQTTGARLIRIASEQSAKALAEHGGVLIKSVVNYRTARITDIAALEAVAQSSGGVIVWDLSHATGVLALDLADSGARLATGCTYKFLNGGPGAPAFIYASADLAGLRSPLTGWMGHAAPFDFASSYAPRANAARFATGTPGILSLSALAAALDAFNGIDPARLAAKARSLGALCLARAAQLGLHAITPTEASERGGHVSLLHDNGYAIVQALAARGVIADYRAPDAMRFGVSPLYISHADVWDAMDALHDILTTRAWDTPAFHTRAAVT